MSRTPALVLHRLACLLDARLSVALLLAASLPLGAAHAVTRNLVGPPGSGAFGTQIVALPNGNVVVADPGYDAPGPVIDVGAVYLYAPDGTLISTLTGTSAGDQVGLGYQNPAITVLANGDFVVASVHWHNAGASGAGAVTWVDGESGLNGTVTPDNSLVGTQVDDQVGRYVLALADGDYVVHEDSWNNGAIVDAGGVTWCVGAGTTVGAVSVANSLVGSSPNDSVGRTGSVFELSNGNYVARSIFWDAGAVADVGAATWGDGDGGTVGAISAANSLVGSTASDQVGITGVALANGHYVITARQWDNGAIVNAGAATWGNGLTGTAGVVSAGNSLVGSSANDQVGFGGITVLTNGNYVVSSPDWDNGTTTNVGAATWGNGDSGIVGMISAANSLIGGTASDRVSWFATRALPNGHYVVRSVTWRNGANASAGAVTWGNGDTGVSGVVSAANSLIGTQTSDRVGDDVTVLANGNYVVSSPSWNNGAVADVGAVTFGNGQTGIAGAVDAANSLIGAQSGDSVGIVRALTNGNYVVASPLWDDGAIVNVGAVTWADGTTGRSGAVSAASALIGSQANDNVGAEVIALSHGHYVVGSANWDFQSSTDAGAVTWGDGTSGVIGVVGLHNSLVGIGANPQLGTSESIIALPYGHYAMACPACIDDGGGIGAVIWGNGNGGTIGMSFEARGLVGSVEGALDDSETFEALPDGRHAFITSTFDHEGALDSGAVTLAEADGSTQGALSSLNSVFGGVAASGEALRFAYDPVNAQLIVARPDENIVTLFRTPLGVDIEVVPDLVTIADDGQCSLREAIHNANADAQVDNDDCPAGDGNDYLTLATEATYTLSEADPDADDNGLPQITSGIMIEGYGATIVRDAALSCVLDGTQAATEFRIFEVAGGGDLILDDVTLRNGCADGSGSANDGGAIKVDAAGRLRLERSRVENSRARDKSGAIDTSGSAAVVILESTISGNVANGGAGGIGHGGDDWLLIERSTISGNSSGGLGGGGIGTFPDAMLRIINSTISGNSSSGAGGGGIGNQGTTEILHSTITNNSVTGALGGGGIGNAGSLEIEYSIVAGNGAGGDCANQGTLTARGTNFDGDGSCAAFTQVTSTQLALAALAFNDGVTQTHALGGTSVAIDAADDCSRLAEFTTPVADQRGVARPVGAACDVGAYEWREPAAQSISFGSNPGPLTLGGPSGTVSAEATSGLPISFGTSTPAICSVHVSSGALGLLAAGDCIVTADQAGNGDYLPAAQVTQTVMITASAGSATVTVQSGLNPAQEGQSVTLTATATGLAPTGSVTFRADAFDILGCTAIALSGNGSARTAVCSTATLAAGVRSITAHYSGDANNGAAVSSALSQTINGRPTVSAPATAALVEDGVGSVEIAIGDAETPAANLQLAVTSSNPSLFSSDDLMAGLSGSGSPRRLNLLPLDDAFGSATLTMVVTDAHGGTRSAQIAVSVTPVNDAPSATYLGDRIHAAGSSGAQAVSAFATTISPGPANENTQTVGFELLVLSDPAAILSGGPSVQANGELHYALSGNSGVATLRLQAHDDGGNADGGIDLGAVHEFRIVVGSGALLRMSIVRVQPLGSLADATAAGATPVRYGILVENQGNQAANDLRLRSTASAALHEPLWLCSADAGTCAPGNGAGAIDARFDVAPGGDAYAELSGSVDASAAFIEIGATLTPAPGTILLPGSSTRVVLVESANASGVFRSGFE